MSLCQIKTIEDLRKYLHVAMQLEHATIPPYITALYSIMPGTNDAAVHVLRTVAVEEMLHLTIAANLLNAVGGRPNLTAKHFVPKYPAYLPNGEHTFQVSVERFSKDAIGTFLKIEHPGMASDAPRVERRPERRGPSYLGACPVDPEMHFATIGEFYEEIRRGFEALDKEALDRGGTVFTGDPKRQVTSEYYYSGGGVLRAVTDYPSAAASIRLIVEQGEGELKGVHGEDGELAHYYRFQELDLGRYYKEGDEQPDKPTGPSLTVDWEKVYPIKTNAKLADYPPGSELREAAHAFNVQYAAFLKLLTRAFNGDPSLLIEAVPDMFKFRDGIVRLIRNPIPGGQGLHGAPTFEIDEVMAETAAHRVAEHA